MNKYLIVFGAFTLIAIILASLILLQNDKQTDKTTPVDMNNKQSTDEEITDTSIANPASQYCTDNGGDLEIVTASDTSQFGLCQFDGYACEEWAFYDGECSIEDDAEKIKDILIGKGLDLSQSKVVIKNHFGKYIEGAVLPVSAPGGGGYVFAVKTDGKIDVLADGNGAIMCSAFSAYPDFPPYLVPECLDESTNTVTR